MSPSTKTSLEDGFAKGRELTERIRIVACAYPLNNYLKIKRQNDNLARVRLEVFRFLPCTSVVKQTERSIDELEGAYYPHIATLPVVDGLTEKNPFGIPAGLWQRRSVESQNLTVSFV